MYDENGHEIALDDYAIAVKAINGQVYIYEGTVIALNDGMVGIMVVETNDIVWFDPESTAVQLN